MSNFYNTIYWKGTLRSTEFLSNLYQVCVGHICSWCGSVSGSLFYSMYLVLVTPQIPHSLIYCSYEISLEIRYINSSKLILLFQNFLAILVPLHLNINFIIISISIKILPIFCLFLNFNSNLVNRRCYINFRCTIHLNCDSTILHMTQCSSQVHILIPITFFTCPPQQPPLRRKFCIRNKYQKIHIIR